VAGEFTERSHPAHILDRTAVIFYLDRHFTVSTARGRIQGEIFMFEILKTTRTGRQMLRTATKTLGSASVVAALIGFAGGLGVA
jgi:hypothetical protein